MTETVYTPPQIRALSRLGVLAQAQALTHWARISLLCRALEDLQHMHEAELPYYEQVIVQSLTKLS